MFDQFLSLGTLGGSSPLFGIGLRLRGFFLSLHAFCFYTFGLGAFLLTLRVGSGDPIRLSIVPHLQRDCDDFSSEEH